MDPPTPVETWDADTVSRFVYFSMCQQQYGDIFRIPLDEKKLLNVCLDVTLYDYITSSPDFDFTEVSRTSKKRFGITAMTETDAGVRNLSMSMRIAMSGKCYTELCLRLDQSLREHLARVYMGSADGNHSEPPPEPPINTPFAEIKNSNHLSDHHQQQIRPGICPVSSTHSNFISTTKRATCPAVFEAIFGSGTWKSDSRITDIDMMIDGLKGRTPGHDLASKSFAREATARVVSDLNDVVFDSDPCHRTMVVEALHKHILGDGHSHPPLEKQQVPAILWAASNMNMVPTSFWLAKLVFELDAQDLRRIRDEIASVVDLSYVSGTSHIILCFC